jgi:crotonobetainyl-CoA:carnitine CoA-transferase CaiB-like acyl-CoA transferase
MAPLDGVVVADFSWVGAGPIAARILADFGATVIRVESARRPDGLRVSGPFKDDVPNIDGSAFFANCNTNKYSVGLNLAHPEGRALGRRLALRADIVTDSMTPGTMARLGLGYEDLSRKRPDLIMFSTTQHGQTGPDSGIAGFGASSSAMAGLTNLVGWPDEEPPGLYGAYTDFISPWMIVAAVLAALDYRGRTGRGQYIDHSQTEAGMVFNAMALLDWTANGRDARREGNRDPSAVPHNAYRCKGDNRWCAVAVETDVQWQALCEVLGHPEWAADERFTTFLGRRQHEAEIDALVDACTSEWDAYELMAALQGAGVPAAVVQKPSDLFEDSRLAEHFWFPEHPVLGRHAVDSPAFKLSDTPARLQRPSPCLGEHTAVVLTEMLGLDADELARLTVDGVLE